MTTFENQITDYPKGARIQAVREISCHVDVIPAGTRGVITGHTNDGRAWAFFDGFDAGHTFQEPERFIRVVCTHRDDNCPANHEEPSRAEQIVREHNQHSTLVAQRERLLRLLRPVTSPTACYCAVMGSEKCWHCEARELITTIEQEGNF